MRPSTALACNSGDRARCFGVAEQRQHVGMAVDDAGGGGQQRGVAVQRRLQRAGFGPRQGLQIAHAIGFGVGPDRLQFLGFRRRGRDDQLAAIAVRNAVVPAVLIERHPSGDAHPRHQAAGLVIDTGVDHLAVARRRDRADSFSRLQHDHLAACQRQPPRHGKADHPRSDNDAINLVHSRLQIPDRCYSIQPAPR
jgi:hypothetical protein